MVSAEVLTIEKTAEHKLIAQVVGASVGALLKGRRLSEIQTYPNFSPDLREIIPLHVKLKKPIMIDVINPETRETTTYKVMGEVDISKRNPRDALNNISVSRVISPNISIVEFDIHRERGKLVFSNTNYRSLLTILTTSPTAPTSTSQPETESFL